MDKLYVSFMRDDETLASLPCDRHLECTVTEVDI